MLRLDITDFCFSRKLILDLAGADIVFVWVKSLLNFDIPLAEIGGSDVFVAVVLPEDFLQDSECEVSLLNVYICLHHRKQQYCLKEAYM